MGYPESYAPEMQQLLALLTSGQITERARGLEQVPALYKTRTMGHVRSKHRTLSPQQLADVWVLTFDEFIDLVEGQTLGAQGSVLELLKTIAVCRAVDLLRKPKVGELSTIVSETRFIRTAPAASSRTVERELLDLVERAINDLPADQRDVLRVYFDNLPESEKLDVLFAEYSTVTGTSRSKDAVRVLRDRAIRKLRNAIMRAGYQLA